jgi:flavorubredoxin
MHSPYKVADETWILPSYMDAPGLGVVYFNPMLIRGKEPILVDCGGPIHREEYLKNAFSLVEPKDVKWIFLSHDDRDHSGNLMQVLDMCPNARLVTNFVAVARMAEEWAMPMPRLMWINDGESFSIGDRTLACLRPPFFDGPATRGLYDAKTGVYYAVDCFGAIVPKIVQEVGEVPADAYEGAFNFFNRVNHPWHVYTDPKKVEAVANKIRALNPKVITTYHGPPARNRTEEMLTRIVKIASMEPLQHPMQKDLEAMLAASPPAAAAS